MVKKSKKRKKSILNKLDSVFKNKLQNMFARKSSNVLQTKSTTSKPINIKSTDKKPKIQPKTQNNSNTSDNISLSIVPIPPPIPPPPRNKKSEKNNNNNNNNKSENNVLELNKPVINNKCIKNTYLDTYIKNILEININKNNNLNKLTIETYKKLNEYNILLIQNNINKIKNNNNNNTINNFIIPITIVFTGFLIGYFFN
tara:strand:+ start:403 stop:1002 length:600 start_codon:yes stop_codon:yes gene_type:complete